MTAYRHEMSSSYYDDDDDDWWHVGTKSLRVIKTIMMIDKARKVFEFMWKIIIYRLHQGANNVLWYFFISLITLKNFIHLNIFVFVGRIYHNEAISK